MSDPYADTVTVRNILNHILSPKVVSDGNGGYTTKVDLVNIDNIVAGSISLDSGSPVSSDRSGVFTLMEPASTIDSAATASLIFFIPINTTLTTNDISFVQVRDNSVSGSYISGNGNALENIDVGGSPVTIAPLSVLASRVHPNTDSQNPNTIEVMINKQPADNTQFAWFTKRISVS